MKLNMRSYLKQVFKGEGRNGVIALLIALGLAVLLIASMGNSSYDEKTAEEHIEERLEELCSSLEGVGRCRVMVTCSYGEARYGTESRPTVTSVAVVCKRGNRAEVRGAVTELITALYGIGANRISVSAGSP